MLRQFTGRTDLAVAAYNARPGAVRKRMAIPPYAETQGYVRTVLAIYETLQPGSTASAATSIGSALPEGRSTTGRRRRQAVIAGSRPAAPETTAKTPARITLKAQAADTASATPSALDEIADKIATADNQIMLDADVHIQPSATTPAR